MENKYEELKAGLVATDVLLACLVTGEAIVKFAPLVFGVGLLGQASVIILFGGALAVAPHVGSLIYDSVHRGR